MKVLVLGTGSVAIKLFPKLLDELTSRGMDIRFMLSEKAMIFGEQYLLGKNLEKYASSDYTTFTSFKNECFKYMKSQEVVHVDNAQWADVILVCPATANTIAKMNYGVCDNVLMDTLLVASGLGKRIIVAPAMNTHMWTANQTQHNVKSLASNGVQFVYPTVKKLACGDYGIGGLADIKAIADKVSGIRWKYPLDTVFNNREINVYPHMGAFGAVRRFDIHKGVDIYCDGPVNVLAVESGEVVETGKFTGADMGSPWWNDTWFATIKGASGYVVYGEIIPLVVKGQKVRTGDKIGTVMPVLKPDKVRRDIRGHSQFMLHLGLKSENVHHGDWKIGDERPAALLDPTAYLI